MQLIMPSNSSFDNMYPIKVPSTQKLFNEMFMWCREYLPEEEGEIRWWCTFDNIWLFTTFEDATLFKITWT